VIFTGVTPEQAKYDKMCNALAFLDKFLEGENYVAGKTLTLADLSLAVTVSNFKVGNWSLLHVPFICKTDDVSVRQRSVLKKECLSVESLPIAVLLLATISDSIVFFFADRGI